MTTTTKTTTVPTKEKENVFLLLHRKKRRTKEEGRDEGNTDIYLKADIAGCLERVTHRWLERAKYRGRRGDTVTNKGVGSRGVTLPYIHLTTTRIEVPQEHNTRRKPAF